MQARKSLQRDNNLNCESYDNDHIGYVKCGVLYSHLLAQLFKSELIGYLVLLFSLLDTDSEDCSCDDKKPLIQRRSSRMPLMHPKWYTSSPLSNVGVGELKSYY